MRTNNTSARCPVYSTPAYFADARSFCVDNGKKLEGAKQPREREKNPERSPTSGPRTCFSALSILTSNPVTNGSQALLHQRSVCDEGRCCRKHHEDSYSTTCPSYRRGYAPYRRPTSDPMARKQSHSRSHRASRCPRPAIAEMHLVAFAGYDCRVDSDGRPKLATGRCAAVGDTESVAQECSIFRARASQSLSTSRKGFHRSAGRFCRVATLARRRRRSCPPC